MIRNAILTAIMAVALTGAPAAGADYEAGQQAWDAGRRAEALSRWWAAAHAGDRRAMFALGQGYVEGLGVVQDYVEAHKWFNLAASPGEVATAQERAAAWRPGTRFRDCDECPELVVVPAGSFRMGSPESEAGRDDDEGPVHRVRIERPFAVGVYEVTRGEYSRFVSATGHRSEDGCWTREGGESKLRSGRHWRSPGFRQTEAHPVICVNWEDARAYVGWLSEKTGEEYRLLSESEWEYVARGGTATARYWGESETGQCSYENGADASTNRSWRRRAGCNDGYARTSPVGSFGANGFGLHDVLGNVLEWVEDCWNDSYGGAPADGSAWESGDCRRRVLRGGSWNGTPRRLRSANRFRYGTGSRGYVAGFRVVRTLTP